MNFFYIFLILFVSNVLDAQEYSVIASHNTPKMSVEELRAIYLKKITFIKNEKVIPLNLPAKNSIRKSFEKNILHMGENRLKHYWIKAHYLGKRPPIMLESQKAIQQFVKRVDGAIGYIESNKKEKNMRVLYQWKDEE